MRNEKGVTMVSLMATVIIILILTSTIVINVDTGKEMNDYRKMCADIDILKEQLLLYYKKYNEIPTKGSSINVGSIQEAEDETGDFYEIDLSKLSNITLNFGTAEEETDKYIVNDVSLNVYYLNGVLYEGETVHAKQ